MKKLKTYEDWIVESNDNVEEFDLKHIINNLPYNYRFKNKNREYVMSSLQILYDKYVSFISSSYKDKKFIRTIINGYVCDFEFDDACRYPVFFKMEEDDNWYNVCDDDKIIINKSMSSAKKYNL
jgi:hypothetical protein